MSRFRSAHTIPLPQAAPMPALSAVSTKAAFIALMVVCWTLPLACLNLHDRRLAPYYVAYDPTTVTKALSRAIAGAVVTFVVMRYAAKPGFGRLYRTLFPWTFFGLWAAASAVWSPLKPLTAGHGLEVVLLSLIAVVTGIACNSEERVSALLLNMSVVGLVMTAVLFGFYRDIVFSQASLLKGTRPGGVLEANAMAGLSGVYLVLLIASYLIGRWDWPRKLLVPGVIVHGLSMYVAHSRGALAVTLLMLMFLLTLMNKRLAVTAAFAGPGIVAIGFLILADPGKIGDSLSSYLMRGQTSEALLHGSGRGELWTAGMNSFLDAPWFGHGYFVMSDSGLLQVWRAEQWQTAHNLLLHVLTGLGIFGMLPLIFALYMVLSVIFRGVRAGGFRGQVARLLMVIVGYWLITGLVELSFLGPVNPATFLFYLCIGMAAGLYQLEARGAETGRAAAAVPAGTGRRPVPFRPQPAHSYGSWR
jgi:O-antigen ligase